MFPVREDEPKYAFLTDKESREKNIHGKFIELVEKNSPLYGKSLNINGDSAVGDNPNRYKQHGFHFTADNCIACHACEAACSEKNDNPAHLAFRSVGYVEGGTYPAYQRMNISMACNHCDDPVCLTGCPTRAYTKFAEYGAVLQDPDICFGCGYCTWVCPYNAPQLDPVKGQVSKCNMCVDRLEVGLKPACVSACLGGALEFGVIENTPLNRDQAKLDIPGFPSTDITHPNIRFQQTRSMPREMTRPDSMPLKYHRDDQQEKYIPVVDEKKGKPQRQWNLRKLLGSHENAHIAFTLCAQTVIGAFMLLIFAPWLGLSAVVTARSDAFLPLFATLFVILAIGMFKLNMHLGKPLRFYRGFNNWRLSPVSREIAGISLFFGGMVGYGFFASLIHYNLLVLPVIHWLAVASVIAAIIGGLVGFYYMYKLYRIPARPYWNHWQTGSSFVGTALVLGSVLILLVSGIASGLSALQALLPSLAWLIFSGLLLEGIGLLAHARDLKRQGGEGAASHFEQTTKFGYAYVLRNTLLGVNLLLVFLLTLESIALSPMALVIGSITLISLLTTTVIGRALFYVLVIPTTMPGAFFWKNKAFEEHARETGLANMPQVGVVPDGH
ncbi:MAG: dimethyl sulfoxide reductase anchor subunit [Gammaproteobacteria bacterium]|nr:dimethyl sulfoxide reductase anchor subunit [Gammaproteobacteria bacterium]MCF6259824.1 dimethyl sulfoxide reductase anchor subunit [Gammaproteobacteria bacterium]